MSLNNLFKRTYKTQTLAPNKIRLKTSHAHPLKTPINHICYNKLNKNYHKIKVTLDEPTKQH